MTKKHHLTGFRRGYDYLLQRTATDQNGRQRTATDNNAPQRITTLTLTITVTHCGPFRSVVVRCGRHTIRRGDVSITYHKGRSEAVDCCKTEVPRVPSLPQTDICTPSPTGRGR